MTPVRADVGGDLATIARMLTSITISGTRSTGHRTDADYFQVFSDLVAPYTARGEAVRFYLGGAPGIDTLGLRWLAGETQVALTVVVPATLAAQPEPARDAVRAAVAAGRVDLVVELEHPDFPSPAAYHVRNRYMVDSSEMLIAFPLATGAAGGTLQTMEYAASKGRPRLIVPV